jgi:hypothetical protein
MPLRNLAHGTAFPISRFNVILLKWLATLCNQVSAKVLTSLYNEFAQQHSCQFYTKFAVKWFVKNLRSWYVIMVIRNSHVSLIFPNCSKATRASVCSNHSPSITKKFGWPLPNEPFVTVKGTLLQIVKQCFVLGWIPCKEVRNGRCTRDLEQGSLGIQVRWDRGGTERADCTYLYGNWNENHELGTGFIVH